MGENITNTISYMLQEVLQEVTDDICDNYCKYRDTGGDDGLCDLLRNGGECPLDRLH